MAKVLISDLSLKAVVDPLDELEIQEAGGGDSMKVLAGDLFSFFITARGRGKADGTLVSGSAGVESGGRNNTGIYAYTLEGEVTSGVTQILCTAHQDGHTAVGRVSGDIVLISTFTIEGGVMVAADSDHSFLVMS